MDSCNGSFHIKAKAYCNTADMPQCDVVLVCLKSVNNGKLKELLPPDSRILRFQESFDLLEDLPENDAALEWVFHVAGGQREGLDFRTLPEDTSLQKKMKALLLSGRMPGAAYCVLARPFR